jgi:hypothetical protein
VRGVAVGVVATAVGSTVLLVAHTTYSSAIPPADPDDDTD